MDVLIHGLHYSRIKNKILQVITSKALDRSKTNCNRYLFILPVILPVNLWVA